MNWHRGAYWLTDDRERVDVAAVHALLLRTYWASGRELETMRVAVEHSLCMTLFHGTRVVGFARAITDYATFAWLADVVVHEPHRGEGLGKWMVDALIHHPRLRVRSQWLVTQDAHGLYERHGFARTEAMKRSVDVSAISVAGPAVVAQVASPTDGGVRPATDRCGLELIEPSLTDSWDAAHALLMEYASSVQAQVCFSNFEAELADLGGRYAGAGGSFLIAREDGRGLGCGALTWTGPGDCELRRLFVKPEARRRGIGAQLCRQLMELARRHGCERIRLHTLAEWHAARRLYQALGFAEVPAPSGGEDARVVFMELPLR